jgi:molybdopterin synthase catalytic subunit
VPRGILPVMACVGVYGFEAIDETLPFIPLAARRLLDTLGHKLSLAGWLSLDLEARQQIVRAGAGDPVDAAVQALVERAVPAPASIAPSPDPDPWSPAPELLAALGPSRPLEDTGWRALRPIDRYALVKSVKSQEKIGRAYEEILRPLVLTHLTSTGDAHMIDVGGKSASARRAVASARVRTTPAVVDAIARGQVAKGDVLAAARVAGILAAKRTPELIPLCHPVQTTSAAVDFDLDAVLGEIRVRATVEAVDRTGVEMEAMVAASIASLTVYDMIKSADRWASIDAVRLEAKTGGKSGAVARSPRPERAASEALVSVRESPLSIDEAVGSVKHPAAGAICVFVGVVRDHSESGRVVRLEYQAYASMAEAEMKRIVAEIAAQTPGTRLAVVHRTGSLAVGEIAVVCAASAPHRAEAYRACRDLIDQVKARAPIWKREHGPDGALWVGWQDARCTGGDHAHDDSYRPAPGSE